MDAPLNLPFSLILALPVILVPLSNVWPIDPWAPANFPSFNPMPPPKLFPFDVLYSPGETNPLKPSKCYLLKLLIL